VKCKNEIILQKKYSSNFKNFRAGIAKKPLAGRLHLEFRTNRVFFNGTIESSRNYFKFIERVYKKKNEILLSLFAL